MSLPFFYVENLEQQTIVLDEDTSKHVVQVLRMKAGEELMLTDGRGKKVRASITDDHRKRCVVTVQDSTFDEPNRINVTIAISLVKNNSRFEWFLEKATEIGVKQIIPMICQRTEKQNFRHDRMKNILVSAMLQSQQSWLPLLHEATEFKKVIAENQAGVKFIAHCLPEEKRSLSDYNEINDVIVLIGPEGDFTPEEIQTAMTCGYQPVALGDTRLRTETAGLVAATLLSIT